MPQDPDLDNVDADPNKPEIPDFGKMNQDQRDQYRRDQREGRDEARREQRYKYYKSRGQDSYAERYAGPTQQVTAEQANAAIGVGGDKELVAAIRELIAAVRSMGGN